MERLNWKKIILFTAVAPFAPVLGQWAECVASGQPCPFRASTIVVPVIPALITTLAALFSNPRRRT